MTSEQAMTPETCPEREHHGKPFRYCPVEGCGWIEPPDPVVKAQQIAALAAVIDPEAFQDHPIEKRRPAAALQWGARRHIALEHAERVLPVVDVAMLGPLTPAASSADGGEGER